MSIVLASIVTLIAIGASVLVGVLGYLIDKNADRSDRIDKSGTWR